MDEEVFLDNMTEANISAFLASKYFVDKSNDMFQRLHKIILLQIQLNLCAGVQDNNGLCQEVTNNGSCTWELYNTEYTKKLEAMIIFMFKEQLGYLKGLEGQDNACQGDDSTCVSDEGQKRKGGRPKNRKTFCPDEHDKHEQDVLRQPEEGSEWIGLYEVPVQSISIMNRQQHLDEMRNGIPSMQSEDNQGDDASGVSSSISSISTGGVSSQPVSMAAHLDQLFNMDKERGEALCRQFLRDKVGVEAV